MENNALYLQRTKLFGVLPAEFISEYIIPKGTVRHYKKDNFIFAAGQRVDEIKILIKGRVNITYYYADGSCSLASTEMPPRVLALDLIATKSKISSNFAVAAEASTVFSLPSAVILEPGHIPEDERQMILSQLLIMLSHLHGEKEKHLMILSRNGIRERVMTYLSMQAQWKKSDSFTIPFSREEMAAYLCVNRSNLSHELSLMREDGIIDFSKNRFTLLQKRPW